MNTYTRIKDIIIEQTGCNADQVEPSAHLYDSLGLEEPDICAVTHAVDEEFDIALTCGEIAVIRTVQDLVTVVEGRAA
jgi:acyl carrier protein